MRYPSIDILRTFALFIMVLVHFGENLSGYAVPMAGLGAPLFAFLSGVSYRLWSRGQESRGRSEEEISKVSIRRGLFVFGVGIAFNVFVWLPEDTFNWDVLTFIGTALLVLNLMRQAPLPIPLLIAALSLLISPILRELADYQAYWTNGYFESDFTLSEVLIGFLATGYFPIFPWITFSLAGFVTASLLFAPREPNSPRPSVLPLVGGGFLLVVVSVCALLLRGSLSDFVSRVMLGGWHMFPPTTEYVLGTLGMAMLLLGLGHQGVDRSPRMLQFERVLNVAKMFSQYAFTIYVLHHVVHLWPLWIYGLAMGQEPTYYWRQAMPTSLSLPLSLLFMVGCYALLYILGPQRRYGIESCMRWLCDEPGSSRGE